MNKKEKKNATIIIKNYKNSNVRQEKSLKKFKENKIDVIQLLSYLGSDYSVPKLLEFVATELQRQDNKTEGNSQGALLEELIRKFT